MLKTDAVMVTIFKSFLGLKMKVTTTQSFENTSNILYRRSACIKKIERG